MGPVRQLKLLKILEPYLCSLGKSRIAPLTQGEIHFWCKTEKADRVHGRCASSDVPVTQGFRQGRYYLSRQLWLCTG